mmetsp:Transcript_11266/g.11314  ORF Transcript_11266/g.11314 Transcript_11266/m.11314 type:complete len:94 (+) Transcript_11266:1601-1882(+)
MMEQVLLLRLDSLLALMRIPRINVIIIGVVLHILGRIHSLIIIANWGDAEVVHIGVYHQLNSWNLLLLLLEPILLFIFLLDVAFSFTDIFFLK